MIENYHNTVEQLYEYKKLPIRGVYTDGFFTNPDIYLHRTQALLEAVGLKGNEIPVVHIAGTSGKGTLAHVIADASARDGNNTGLYTSPTIQTQTSRIQIDSQLISSAEFCELVDQVLIAARVMTDSPWGRPSVGEVDFVVAYKNFVDQGCDLAVIEAMLGGRYDATNAIENKVATVLTRVGLDHMHVLGDSREKIALDKSYIARPGVKLFCGETDPEIVNIIRAVTENIGAELVPVAAGGQYSVLQLASAVLQEIGVKSNPIHLQLPGRLEVVKYQGRQLLLDGAHNQQKMAYLIDYINEQKFQQLHVILATSNNKNSKQFMTDVMQRADNLILTSFKISDVDKHTPKLAPRSINELARIADSIGQSYQSIPNPIQAVDRAVERSNPDDLVLVTGSLYLVAKIRELFYSTDDIVTQRTMFPTLR